MERPPTPDRPLSAYADLLGEERLDDLRDRGENVAGTRVCHVNSTASGGGVAELLRSLVPLFEDVGVETDWAVMEADEPFFDVTKRIHNGLQGEEEGLTPEMHETYRETTERNARAFSGEYDVVVLHDPQPLGMIGLLRERFPDSQFVWRCHIDCTAASEPYQDLLWEHLEGIDHAVFSREVYGETIGIEPRSVVYPAIDPFTEKNRPLTESEQRAERDRLSSVPFDGEEPILTQVSRFDPWKDPLGVIDAFREVQEGIPDAQLMLLGGMADDDPEGREVYERVLAEAGEDAGVHLLTNEPDLTVNYVQSHSDVVVQKSIREGFGLVVSEALWKRTPVVASRVGGIPLQIDDGETGYLTDPRDTAAVADRVTRLFNDRTLRERLGENAREHVRDRFLLPRQLGDYLDLFDRLG
ncbi:glycosyltransferase [Natronorarus salvus]|uniref:glycosyltransferase n=1 Tax=Natronorarus salvus TaxID=3117733 RepID=UPI002F26066B